MTSKNRISQLAVASLVFMTGMAAADQHAGGAPGSTAVPTTSDEWFKAGKQAVLQNKFANSLPNLRRAKNVILFVGDGMGVSTVTAARILEGQQRGVDGEFNRLSFERFPNLALSVTASANQQTSDSAPTATAMVAGIKTNDGAVSVDQAITRAEPSAEVTAAHSVKTILERAEERGMATGVVTTARVTHATPAVNYAHISNRDWEANNSLPAGATVKDIARQLIEFPFGDGVDVVLGGGRAYFTPARRLIPSTRPVSAIAPMAAIWPPNGPHVRAASTSGTRLRFDAIEPTAGTKLLGLFERSHVKYEHDRATDPAGEPSIAEMTEKAIKILRKNPRAST